MTNFTDAGKPYYWRWSKMLTEGLRPFVSRQN